MTDRMVSIEALCARLNEYPIPTRVGVTTIMRLIDEVAGTPAIKERLYTMAEMEQYGKAYADARDKRLAAPTQGADGCKPGGCTSIGCEGGHYCFNADGTRKATPDRDALAKALFAAMTDSPTATQGADDTQVVIAGLNALLHDAQDEIARLTAMQGADGEILRPVAIEAPRPSVFRSFETMCWPAPCEALGEIGHRLTYDHSDKSDRLVAASVISAYQHLMSMPAKRRDAIVSELRKGPGVIAASAPMGKS